MKKTYAVVAVLVIALLLVPISTESFDNGTKVYESLTYAFVEWHAPDGAYENSRLYWFPERGIDNLIKLEMDMRAAG